MIKVKDFIKFRYPEKRIYTVANLIQELITVLIEIYLKGFKKDIFELLFRFLLI